ncbi:MAG: Hsp20/alpha crystallin family protein [Burkholderiales bacterium]|nr:Hsp20/alpha crystallin family protein [Burkholderiales bacterium]
MANITTYSPFEEIARFNPLDDPFEDLFRGFFVRPLALESRMWGQSAPFRMDVTENDKEYRVVAEIPGVRKEDISVTIDGDQVSIAAEVKREKDVKDDEKALWSERHYGKLYRAFTLGHEIDQANAQAKYTDGVLELTLPKSESASGKRVTVH